MDTFKPDYSTARLALAHRTTLATQRKATTFLWSFQKLLGCFNHETSLGPITVDTLLAFIERCISLDLLDDYPGYQLAMTSVDLQPYNVDGRCSLGIRCRPVIPIHDLQDIQGDKMVEGGDYLIFFRDPSGANIYQPNMRGKTDYMELFESFETLESGMSFFEVAYRGTYYGAIPDDVQCEAAQKLPHNGSFERCVVTGQQSAGSPGDPGSIQAGWIYPPTLIAWHDGPQTNAEELMSWTPDSTMFQGPSNLISMRKDVYDLFQKNAFGIDIDALPRARIYVFDRSQVDQVEAMSQLHYPAVEITDVMARNFLREHFQKCLSVGILGGDVMDDLSCTDDVIQRMLLYRRGRSTQNPDPVKDKLWETDMGNALSEWCSYVEWQRYADEDESEDEGDEDEY